MKKIPMIFVFIFSQINILCAEEWKYLGTANANSDIPFGDYGKVQIYIDSESITPIEKYYRTVIDGHYMRASILYDYDKPQPNDGRPYIYSELYEIEVECTTNKFKETSVEYYNKNKANGNILGKRKLSNKFEHVDNPNSIAKYIIEFICY